jgi:hypothetical protein
MFYIIKKNFQKVIKNIISKIKMELNINAEFRNK